MRINAFLVTTILIYLSIYGSYAQDKRHYHVLQEGNEKKAILQVNASAVNCRIQATAKPHVVSVYGYPHSSKFHPVSHSKSEDNTQQVTLNFEDSSPANLSTSISSSMLSSFSEKEQLEKPWYIYLAKNVPYELSLNYGMGSSSVDLSGIAVENLKVKTGSASLKIGYASSRPNDVVMDTFYTRVDLGTLQLDHLNLARARNVIADIGFGKLSMQFSDNLPDPSQVKASVGAGSLSVSFANINNPVIIHVSDSPLCRVTMPSKFKKIEKNTFVNEFYEESADNILSFDIDVSIGNVEFLVTD